MPVYHLTFTNGRRVIPDLEGIELADEAAARTYAREEARYLVENRKVRGGAGTRWRVEIADQDGRPVMTLPFAEIASPPSERRAR